MSHTKLTILVTCVLLAGCNLFTGTSRTGGSNDGSNDSSAIDMFVPPGADSGGATCGNGVIEDGELCDGNCPAGCDDGNACTVDMVEVLGPCQRRCVAAPITVCVDDGCCGTGCTAVTDPDCATCGNGRIDANETCDGDCPTSCGDEDACTTDTLFGAAASCNAVCEFDPIEACLGGDGCCPEGCDLAVDSDCAPQCGNGVLDEGEFCDPAITIGEGMCPTSCNDEPCETSVLLGSAADCTALCDFEREVACISADNCCPNGCVMAMDSDCSLTIGSACVEDEDCPVVRGDRKCEDFGFPGGYCSGECDSTADCPGESICVEEDCYATCAVEADCRTGYICELQTGNLVCVPAP